MHILFFCKSGLFEKIDVFRHCQRCRADAIGIPGEKEVGPQIYQNRIKIKETFSHG